MIKSQDLSNVSTFAFKADDAFIGKDGTNSNTQFMGELYETSLSKGNIPSQSLTTLSPSYSNILFYYTFGE